jgi:hypothetical protein
VLAGLVGEVLGVTLVLALDEMEPSSTGRSLLTRRSSRWWLEPAVEAAGGVVGESRGTRAVLEVVTASSEGGRSRQSSGRCPRWRKVLAVG